MTDAMTRAGQSVWKVLVPFGRRAHEVRDSPWVLSIGDRLYVDFGPLLRVAPTRKLMLTLLPRIDQRAAAALPMVMARPGFARGDRVPFGMLRRVLPRVWGAALGALLFRRPETVHADMHTRLEAFVVRHVGRIREAPAGAERIEVAREEVASLLPELFTLPARIVTGLASVAIIRKLVREADPADLAALSRGLDGNVTIKMDLELGDLADSLAGRSAVVEALQAGVRDRDELEALPGGEVLREGLTAFLDRWGSRGIAEIDIGRPRWKDDPSQLLGMLAGNLGREPEAHRTRHAELRASRLEAGARIRKLAGRGLFGWLRGPFVGRMLRLHWSLAPLREHPKFALVRVLQAVRDAVLDGGRELCSRGLLSSPEDALAFELHELAALLRADADAPDRPACEAEARQALRRRNQSFDPPRVLTEHGESPRGQIDAGDSPEGSLIGTPVSAGVIEGVARVIHDPAGQTLQPGEILVAPHTDPGWTPLFLNAAGLVMEVGGLVTHGSVVAREYGIPAVICVPDACAIITTGQRLRVDGDRGWVEIIDDEEASP
jgi:pyruvate,water dikinase